MDERYRHFFQFSNDALILADAELRIVDANERAAAMYGWSLAELRAKTLYELRAPDAPGALADAMARAPDGVVVETSHRRRDGSRIEVEVSWRVVDVEGRRGFALIVNDVGERNRVTRRMDYLNRAHKLLGGVGAASARVHSRQALFDETCAIAVEAGRFSLAWIGVVDPSSDRVTVAAARGTAVRYLDGIVVTHTADPGGRGPTGTAIREARVDVVDDFESTPRMSPWRERAIAAGLRSSAAFPLFADGRVFGALMLYANEPGFFGAEEQATLAQVAEVVSFAVDALEREEARRRLERDLQEAQKLESLSLLAGGVAHDFNNLITCVMSYADLLTAELAPGTQSRADAEEIRRAGERAAALTRQLLAFSRRQPVAPVVVDLNAIVKGLYPMVRRVIGEHLEVSFVVSDFAPVVRADPSQLEQVILNLIVNARDAMPNGGAIRVETRVAPADAVDQAARGGAPTRALLRVTDTGVGMNEDTLTHVFEPFFTTKALGRGTGLGLSTCFGIVKQCGGSIRATSKMGEGSTFEVELPLVVGEPPSSFAAARLPSTRPERLSGTVLVAEDDPALLALATRALSALGLDVLPAANGEEALRIFQERGASISLIVSDVVMPRLGGPELARAVRAVRREVPILFVSGYLDEQTFRGLDVDASNVLPKPFTAGVLTARVSALLGGGA